MSTDTAVPFNDPCIDGIHDIARLCLTRPDYKFSLNSLPMPGATTTVQELLFLTGGIGDKLLKGKHFGPNKPSITSLSRTDPAHDVTVIRSRRSPDLFLTKGMLDSEIVVSRSLWVSLHSWAEDTAPDPINENRITTAILKPLFLVWLKVWTDASMDPATESLEWNTRSLDPSEGRGDVDVLVTRILKGTDRAVEVAAIEAKTPLSCGHNDILNFGKSGDLKDGALSRQCIRHLMRCNKSMKDNFTPWRRWPTFGALTVYPGHFFPVAYQDDTNRFVAFPDVADIKGEWPETRDKFENHMKASSIAAAWAFMVVVTADEELKRRWAKVCQKQVDQAMQWTTTAGEQLASPNRLIATLTGCWAAVSALIYQAVFSLLVALVALERFKALELPNGDEIVVDSAANIWRLPFNLTLPLPDAFHKSHTAQTFVISWPRVVVKVYDDVEQYAHECAFYERWSGVLGSSIPTLHAHGWRIDDNKPFLIFSNEGERITDLTEEDRAIVQRSVLDVIHEEGWHHHDLAARNVLRKPSGELCLRVRSATRIRSYSQFDDNMIISQTQRHGHGKDTVAKGDVLGALLVVANSDDGESVTTGLLSSRWNEVSPL